MEMSQASATMAMATRNNNLAIEDYLQLTANRDIQLNSRQLRKVISMHGFKKTTDQKRISLDAVKTMDLMDLRRSTLKDNSMSGDACLSLDGVIRDLNRLEWQECHITSLITLGTPPSATQPFAAKRPRKNLVKVEADNSTISTLCTTVAAGSTTVSLKKKKKSKGSRAEGVAVSVKGEKSADDSTISTKSTTVASGGTTAPGKAKKWKELKILSTTVASGGTTAPAKAKKSKELGKILSTTVTSGGATVSAKQKKSERLQNKTMVENAGDNSASGTAVTAGGTTVSKKRKRLKGLGLKPVEVAVDRSMPTTGTTLAAGSTPERSVDS